MALHKKANNIDLVVFILLNKGRFNKQMQDNRTDKCTYYLCCYMNSFVHNKHFYLELEQEGRSRSSCFPLRFFHRRLCPISLTRDRQPLRRAEWRCWQSLDHWSRDIRAAWVLLVWVADIAEGKAFGAERRLINEELYLRSYVFLSP